MAQQAISTDQSQKKKFSNTKIRVWGDLLFFMGMVLVLAPQATGIPVHEWASLLVIIPFFLHLILDWKWIKSITARFLKRIQGEARFNYVLDWLLFVLFVVAMFTGVVISEAVLPSLGFPVSIDPFWSMLHEMSANLLIVVIGIHLAMHWNWIVVNFKKYVLGWPSTGVTTKRNE